MGSGRGSHLRGRRRKINNSHNKVYRLLESGKYYGEKKVGHDEGLGIGAE